MVTRPTRKICTLKLSNKTCDVFESFFFNKKNVKLETKYNGGVVILDGA